MTSPTIVSSPSAANATSAAAATRSRAARAGYWAFIVVYALFFGEAFIRLFAPTPVMPRYVTGAPYGIRVGMPNMSFWQHTPETQAFIHTNSRGIRANREFAYDKPPGTCRILLFGDSFFVGYEVNLEDSFAYLLEQRVLAAGHHCEVINMAVSGFGTAEMLIALREEGVKYHPDIVVFSSNISDLDDNIRSSLYSLDPAGKLVRKNQTFLPGISLSDRLSRFTLYRWLSENSQLYSAVRERSAFQIKNLLLAFEKKQETANAIPAAGAGASTLGMQERLNLALLQQAKQVAEDAHAHFMVLEVPESRSRVEFERGLPDYGPAINQALALFSPLDAFRAAADPTRKIYYEHGQGHLTPFGNRLLADYFFDRLQHTGWLP